jgi:predicted AAA+ superfamily ATPase
MVLIHPQIIEKDGKKEYAVLPYDEFVKIQEELEDYEDLKLLREAKVREGDAPTMTLDEVREELGLKE